MSEIIRKKLKVEVTPSKKRLSKKPLKKKVKKEVSEKELPIWSFPLQGRSVRARNLAEAEKIIKDKK